MFRKSLRGAVLALSLSGLVLGGALGQDSTATDVASLRQVALGNSNDVEAWLNLGNAYLEAGDYDAAKESFLEAIAVDYRSGDAHFGLGLAEYRRGDYPAALFEFSEVTRLYPDRFDGHFNRAVTLAKLRKFDEAADAFRQAINEVEPEASTQQQVDAHLGLAGQLKRLENFSAAADAYAAALELKPNDAELAYQKAESLYFAGRGLEALPELSELEARSSDHRVSSLISDIYIQQEQIDYAMRSLERALSRAEGTADLKAEGNILLKMGLLQKDLGQDGDAAASFQRAVAANPGSWQAQYHLGVSYLEAGQAASSVGFLEQASALNPDSGEIYMALTMAYEQSGRIANVMPAAEAALELIEDPSQVAQIKFAMGRVQYYQGDYESALASFEDVLLTERENALAQLWTGLAEYQLENYQSAVRYLESAVQLDPESIEARANLGAAYFQSERFQDAELVFELILEDNASDADALYNLGLALLAQNQRDAAQEVWLQAANLGYSPAQTALREYF